jgi:hypothetical protein
LCTLATLGVPRAEGGCGAAPADDEVAQATQATSVAEGGSTLSADGSGGSATWGQKPILLVFCFISPQQEPDAWQKFCNSYGVLGGQNGPYSSIQIVNVPSSVLGDQSALQLFLCAAIADASGPNHVPVVPFISAHGLLDSASHAFFFIYGDAPQLKADAAAPPNGMVTNVNDLSNPSVLGSLFLSTLSTCLANNLLQSPVWVDSCHSGAALCTSSDYLANGNLFGASAVITPCSATETSSLTALSDAIAQASSQPACGMIDTNHDGWISVQEFYAFARTSIGLCGSGSITGITAAFRSMYLARDGGAPPPKANCAPDAGGCAIDIGDMPELQTPMYDGNGDQILFPCP